MKRLIYNENGEPLQVLRCEEYVPEEPGYQQVQVRWQSSSIVPADLATVRGLYKLKNLLPGVPGVVGAGEVVKVGENVKDFKPGQRVMLAVKKNQPYRNGSWQSVGNVPMDELMHVPEHINLSTDALSEFTISYLPAWLIVKEYGRARSGDWILVTAGASTLGKVIIQLSKIFGYKVIAVIRREEPKQELLDLGAAEVIVSSKEDVVQRVKVITKLKGAQVAVDFIGGESAGACLRSLADNGRLIVNGLLGQERYMPIDTKAVIFNSLQIMGFWVVDWALHTDPYVKEGVFSEVFHWMHNGKLLVPVHAKFPLEDYQKAIEEAAVAGSRGRVLFTP